MERWGEGMESGFRVQVGSCSQGGPLAGLWRVSLCETIIEEARSGAGMLLAVPEGLVSEGDDEPSGFCATNCSKAVSFYVMSLIVASKALQLCKGSATAPLKRAKNLAASRIGPAKNVTHQLSSFHPAWPSGLFQSSFTSSKIQHTHTNAKWSQVRTYATQPGAQNDDATVHGGWSEVCGFLLCPSALEPQLAVILTVNLVF